MCFQSFHILSFSHNLRCERTWKQSGLRQLPGGSCHFTSTLLSLSGKVERSQGERENGIVRRWEVEIACYSPFGIGRSWDTQAGRFTPDVRLQRSDLDGLYLHPADHYCIYLSCHNAGWSLPFTINNLVLLALYSAAPEYPSLPSISLSELPGWFVPCLLCLRLVKRVKWTKCCAPAEPLCSTHVFLSLQLFCFLLIIWKVVVVLLYILWLFALIYLHLNDFLSMHLMYNKKKCIPQSSLSVYLAVSWRNSPVSCHKCRCNN